MTTPKKVSFHTLGCKLNFSETSTLARRFEEGGYVRTPVGRDADICVINSCSVTEHADKKCRNLIRRLHRENPDAIIAVTGCYAQLKAAEISAIEGVDIVLGNNFKGELFDRVSELRGKGAAQSYGCETAELTGFFSAFSTGDRTRSFLKVQDGCDYKCTYCTIHNARGSSRNISVEQAVDQARRIAEAGQKEIVITGINTGDFGHTTGESFLELLQALDTVSGIERYRISSIEPNLLTDRIIEFCARSYKFQDHFHIPLQSGSDKILKAMHRRYGPEVFAERIAAVRERIPDAFLGIDVIVGFPGETEEDFDRTFSLLERTAPAFLHIFPFSERPGTVAYDMPGKVRDSIKTARAQRLGELSKRLHDDFNRRYIGKTLPVLFENSEKGGYMSGFTGNYIKVKVPYNRRAVNEILPVLIEAADGNGNMTGSILASDGISAR